VTSLLSAIASITLSISLTLGSTVALAAPPAGGETPPPDGTGSTQDEKSEAEALSDKAIVEFEAKNFAGAVELFQKAYELDPLPNYLFNIGRVYEEAGDFPKAIEYYGNFVKQPGVDIESREFALERLRVLRAILEETQEPKEEPKDPPKDEPEVVPQPQPQPQVDTEAQRKKKAMRMAGFGIVGAGAGALIAGAVVGSLAQGDNDKAFDQNEADTLAARQDLLDKSKTKALTADVLFGVGGALLLTGIILVAVGYSKPKSQPPKVAFTPTFGPTGGGFDLRLRF
jgi:tetratricopeptide (TPR) repeat protein